MFDKLEAPPNQTESPLPEMVAPEDLVDELSSALTRRDRDEARIIPVRHND
jgi:hypothetical protein